MKFIIGKKIEMTQVWQGERVVAVTKVLAGPCPVVQLKNKSQDGYSAIQLGFGERKEKNIKKPQIGHLNKSKVKSQKSKVNLRYLREFRCDTANLKMGDVVDATTFAVGDIIKVTGTSKGKGFQGGVKRHHFHGHNTTHGTKDQVRTSGAIGAGGPQHVFKGKRMPGRMGNARITTSNLKVVQVDQANNILYISGAVPGARNGLLLIYGEGELKIASSASSGQARAEVAAAVKAEAEKKPAVKAEAAAPAGESVKSGAVKKEEAPADKAKEIKTEAK